MLALALLASLHSAEPATDGLQGVALRWSVPRECPDEADLRARVEILLGAPLTLPGRTAIEIDASITGSQDHWRLSLGITSSGGARDRELPGTNCQDLTEIASVLIAVAIDPTLSGEPTPTPTPTSTPDPTVRSAAAPDELPRPPTEVHSTRRVAGAIGVHGGIGFGPLPRVAGNLGVDGAVLVRHARIELGGSFWLPRETRGTMPAVGSVRLWHVDVRGCGVPSSRLGRTRSRRLEFPLCGGLELGAMTGSANAVARPRVGRLPWIAVELSAGVIVLPSPRAGFRLDVRGAVPVTRPGFAVDDRQVFRARAAAITATLGLELRLP